MELVLLLPRGEEREVTPRRALGPVPAFPDPLDGFLEFWNLCVPEIPQRRGFILDGMALRYGVGSAHPPPPTLLCFPCSETCPAWDPLPRRLCSRYCRGDNASPSTVTT